jgi:glyoxylase-like metal-dependent hydrolase (beta-lactamase superfamily II)
VGPNFSECQISFSEKELDTWQNSEHEKFSCQPLVDGVLPEVAAGQARLVSNDYALDDEVWLEPAPGHTPDHYSVRFASRGENAVMSGDLMHCPVQCLHPEWQAWPDWDPELASATRRAFMERYCETDTLVCTAHFPLPSAGRVIRDGDVFGFEYDTHAW